jgi:hypothetical protein
MTGFARGRTGRLPEARTVPVRLSPPQTAPIMRTRPMAVASSSFLIGLLM